MLDPGGISAVRHKHKDCECAEEGTRGRSTQHVRAHTATPRRPRDRRRLRRVTRCRRTSNAHLQMPLPLALSDLGLKLEHLSGASDKDAQQPRIGQTATVRFTGRLRDSSGTVFDSTDGKPDFSLRVGRGMVIGGWDAALLHMTCGSRYRLTVPAVLAYGARGKPGLIPPNSQLCFDIELTGIVADSPAELLLDAASTGDAAALVRALREGADVGHADRKGATALHLASAGGHAECVVRLLEASAAVDAVQSQPSGVTPLMHAVKSAGDPLCARLLLLARADPHKQSAKGNSALSLMASDKEYADSEEIERGTAAPAASADDVLGTGMKMAQGWELLRTTALWCAARRRDNPRCWLKLVVEPLAKPTGAAAEAEAASSLSDAPLVEVELYADVVPRTAENFPLPVHRREGQVRRLWRAAPFQGQRVASNRAWQHFTGRRHHFGRRQGRRVDLRPQV